MTLKGTFSESSLLSSRLITTSLLLAMLSGQLKTENMKSVRIIFIAMEVLSLIGVALLSYVSSFSEDDWMRSTMITLFALLAVVMQKEQIYCKIIDEETEED